MTTKIETIRILLIEDNPDDAKLIQAELTLARSYSFECQWVDGLGQGIDLLSQSEIDVVLLDLFLPDSNGVESFNRLHGAAPTVPVILLTGLNDESLALQAAQQGAQDYLLKDNLDHDLLSRSIRYAIERSRLRAEAEQHLVENAKLRAAIMEERNRMARDLHDSVSQSIYSLSLWAEAGRRSAANRQYDMVSGLLEQIGGTAQQALKEMRLLIYELRPMDVVELGLVATLQQRLEAVEQRGGLDARLLVEGDLNLSPTQEYELHQMIQEALNNVIKHAQARSVTVSLDGTPDRVEVEVRDDGRGFDPNFPIFGSGIGMSSLQERAERLGADLNIESEGGIGTSVRIRMPRGPE